MIIAYILNTLWILLLLHLAVPCAYLVFRMMGGEWDGLAWAGQVLYMVHELRTPPLPHYSDVPTRTPSPSELAYTDHA